MSRFPPGHKCYVAYNGFDPDKVLFVTGDIYKNGDRQVFSGTEKECRKYIIENQKKAETPSIFALPPLDTPKS